MERDPPERDHPEFVSEPRSVIGRGAKGGAMETRPELLVDASSRWRGIRSEPVQREHSPRTSLVRTRRSAGHTLVDLVGISVVDA